MTALVVLEAVAIGFLGLLVAGLLRSHAEILRQLHGLGADLDPTPRPARTVGPIIGTTPDGDTVSISVGRRGERTLLVFLSSTCSNCAPLWDGLAAGGHHRALRGTRVVVVTSDAGPTLDVPVVVAPSAWTAMRVPGSPYAVLVDDGEVIGEGVARSVAQLGSLVGQHLGDRQQRVDAELLAAGVRPGDASLYPQ